MSVLNTGPGVVSEWGQEIVVEGLFEFPRLGDRPGALGVPGVSVVVPAGPCGGGGSCRGDGASG
jgi:hypothetical protein